LQPNVKKGSLKTPNELIRFTWDNEAKSNIEEIVKSGAFNQFPDKI
jgi:hypothetical protein